MPPRVREPPGGQATYLASSVPSNDVLLRALNGPNREVVKLDRTPACVRNVVIARPAAILALAVHPEQVLSTPVADDRGHAHLEGCRQLEHSNAAVVVVAIF